MIVCGDHSRILPQHGSEPASSLLIPGRPCGYFARIDPWMRGAKPFGAIYWSASMKLQQRYSPYMCTRKGKIVYSAVFYWTSFYNPDGLLFSVTSCRLSVATPFHPYIQNRRAKILPAITPVSVFSICFLFSFFLPIITFTEAHH